MNHKRSKSIESQLTGKNKALGMIILLLSNIEEKLDEAIRRQHELENKVEEYEVFKFQAQEANKQVKQSYSLFKFSQKLSTSSYKRSIKNCKIKCMIQVSISLKSWFESGKII